MLIQQIDLTNSRKNYISVTLCYLPLFAPAMTRRVFYSFHYSADSWRASQIRNIGVVEGNRPATDNEWEDVARNGTSAIRQWIDTQMIGRSCVVVLIGSETANRFWINYEIGKAFTDGKKILGIYIHRLKDRYGEQSRKGANPFSYLESDGTPLDEYVATYDPPGRTSTDVYACIRGNLEGWIEAAFATR